MTTKIEAFVVLGVGREYEDIVLRGPEFKKLVYSYTPVTNTATAPHVTARAGAA